MTRLVLPLTGSAEIPDYEQRTSLDGRDYIFRFRWNQREAAWYFDISDHDDALIVAGLKAIIGWPLLRLVTDARRPPGELMFFSTTPGGDPGLDDLGPQKRVQLVYFDAEHLGRSTT